MNLKTVSQKIRDKYDLMDDDSARIESLEFYKRIIEDIVGSALMDISYDEVMEYIIADFGYDELIINVAMNSLSACTRDVINEATNWRDNQ